MSIHPIIMVEKLIYAQKIHSPVTSEAQHLFENIYAMYFQIVFCS